MKSYFKALLVIYGAMVLTDLSLGLLFSLFSYFYYGVADLPSLSDMATVLLVKRPFNLLPELFGIAFLVNKVFPKENHA